MAKFTCSQLCFFFTFLFLLHGSGISLAMSTITAMAKDQITCTMCSSCDNPCQPVLSPPPPLPPSPSPPPPLPCPPPPSLPPPPPPPSVPLCPPPPEPVCQPTCGGIYPIPTPPPPSILPCCPPPPPYGIFPFPPSPIVPYLTPTSSDMSNSIQLRSPPLFVSSLVIYISLLFLVLTPEEK